MSINSICTREVIKKEFIKSFDTLCYSRNRWKVWSDFITMAAISISNAVDMVQREERENTYLKLVSNYKKEEQQMIVNLFDILVKGYEQSIDQDFLGELYMGLELGNKNNGQFFTPYSVCKMMAKINFPDVKEQIKKKGWISVNDPACGAGALLVAFASECIEQKVNYQSSVLFVAQDIDYITGCMCYIQLSLLGCPGYVVIADTITKPIVSYNGSCLIPAQKEGQTFWFTPFYFRSEWHYRRIFFELSLLLKPVNDKEEKQTNKPEIVKEHIVPDLVVKKNGQISLF